MLLGNIFEQLLEHSHLSNDRNIGKVLRLDKTGDERSADNFRRIPLISISCKILEHITYSHLVNFFESNAFSTPAKHGFRKSY